MTRSDITIFGKEKMYHIVPERFWFCYYWSNDHIVYKCFSCFRPGMGHFFHLHTCLYLSRFFCCIIRKYLSHILFWSQLLAVCFTMKLFFSFKIHCLQMFQLFQTRDGPFFFVVTLVYTCHTFFALSSENICPIYIWLHLQDF